MTLLELVSVATRIILIRKIQAESICAEYDREVYFRTNELSVDYYKLIFNKGCKLTDIYFYNKIDKKWAKDISYISMNKDFIITSTDEIGEIIEKDNEIIKSLITLCPPDGISGHSESLMIKSNQGTDYFFDFSTYSQREEWKFALQILMKLKSHPLAIPLKKGKQWFITLFQHDTGKYYATAGCKDRQLLKIDLISPAFETMEDCKKARDDLGNDDIVRMFLTFQGVDNEC